MTMRKKPITSRPIGVGIRMRRVAKVGEVVIDAPAPPPPPPPPPSELDADALIITYYFTEDGGRDLDTRTRIVEPLLNDNFVGWCRGNAELYTFFSGDNTGFGVESVWIDVAGIRAAHGADAKIRIECRAFWWGARASGDMVLSVAGLKGGTRAQDGFTFYALGGTIVAAQLLGRNIVLLSNNCVDDGDLVGYVEYQGTTLSIVPA
jgi:hypothetical protein